MALSVGSEKTCATRLCGNEDAKMDAHKCKNRQDEELNAHLYVCMWERERDL